jgi:hypothetical protein
LLVPVVPSVADVDDEGPLQAGRWAGGGVIHIWGHSWEVEENDDWQRLSCLLSELAARDHVTMVTNAQLGRHMRQSS